MSEDNGFKVNDRRLFDADGNERPVEKTVETSKPESTEKRGADFIAKDKPENIPPEIQFTSFVFSIATQALIMMGEMEPPEGINLPKDRNAAKQNIDLLKMLQEKTKGNLTADEAMYLDESLHMLQMRYVQSMQINNN